MKTPLAVICLGCASEFKISANHVCPSCGGVLSLNDEPLFEVTQIDSITGHLWRYSKTFPLDDKYPHITLGEGGTPLVSAEIDGQLVYFKMESLNPTGSFKDRGSAILTSVLAGQCIKQVCEDSSGNAGSSLAAYCARAGIDARIYVPEGASVAKLKQTAAYGAELVPVSGGRSKVMEAALDAARRGMVYASHIDNPAGIAGTATCAFEIYEQLGSVAADAIILPVGGGTLLLGLYRGFRCLQRTGLIARLPRLFGVQAAAFSALTQDGPLPDNCKTIAEGIQIRNPARRPEIIQAIKASNGGVFVVSEQEIQEGTTALARRGLYVEPTSAVIWSGLQQLRHAGIVGPVVAILTGNGLKAAAA